MNDLLAYYARRIVLIGQAPSKNEDPSKPLTGRPGRKLAEFAGLTFPTEYARLFERVNLLREFPGETLDGKGDLFPITTAFMAANELKPELRGRVVIMLGRNVASAIGHECHGDRCMEWFEWRASEGTMWGLMPHPSPRNRMWQKPLMHQQGSEFMHEASELARGFGERWRLESKWIRDHDVDARRRSNTPPDVAAGRRRRIGFGNHGS